MRTILKYTGYFLSIAGAAAIIWQAAVYFANSSNEISNMKADVKIIKEAVMIQAPKNDSLIFKVDMIKHQVEKLDKGQDKLRGVVIYHIANDKSVTKDDLVNIINNLEEKKNSNFYMIR
jgi:hypothetical protein